MVHLAPIERMKIIAIFNDLRESNVRCTCHCVSEIAKASGIDISTEGVRLILKKWQHSSIVLIHLV